MTSIREQRATTTKNKRISSKRVLNEATEDYERNEAVLASKYEKVARWSFLCHGRLHQNNRERVRSARCISRLCPFTGPSKVS